MWTVSGLRGEDVSTNSTTKLQTSLSRRYKLALSEKDYPAQLVLQWFISEQTEEEKTVGEIIAQLRMIGDNGSALLMIDRLLAARK